MKKNELIKIKAQGGMPYHVQFLTKDTKFTEEVSFSFIKKYNGNGIVGEFYKPNSIIFDRQNDNEDAK